MNPAKPTIMLVDRRPGGMAALSACLEDADYSLVAADDGQAAWEMLIADPGLYDVLILDRGITCPGGEQLLDKMQGHPILQGMPAILQVESSDQLRTPLARSYGFQGRLVKPFDRAQVVGALATALQSRICYRSSQADWDQGGGGLGASQEATFTFKTLHSARDLAALLANSCPEPQRVIVGLAELFLNAVEHGNLCISYEQKTHLRREDRWEEEVAARLADPTYADREVWVEYTREPDRIRVRIRDQGDGFDWRSYLAMDPASATGLHGRGIAIARMMSFDSVAYRGKGNEVEVTVSTRPC